MLNNNRYKSQRRDLIQTSGANDILLGTSQGTTGKYMMSIKPGLIIDRQKEGRYNEEQVLKGLQGWWFLSEPIAANYYDFSGSDATATSVGIITTTYSSPFGAGQIINQGGTGTYLTISNPSNVAKFAWLNGSSFTIATWVRFDDISGNYGNILEIFETTSLPKYMVIAKYPSASTIYIQGGSTTISNTSVSAGKWFHLAITYIPSPAINSYQVSIYIDGVLDITNNSGTPLFTGNLTQTGSTIRFGYRNAAAASLQGGLNDTRIYNRALSGIEIQYLYNLPKGRLAPILALANTTQNTQWNSGTINTNQLGSYKTELGRSTTGTPFTPNKNIQPVAGELRGYWLLDADGSLFQPDISGQLNPATTPNSSILITDPEIGSMISLNGTTDYVDMSSNITKLGFVNTGSFTFCMWVKLANQSNIASNDPLFELGTSTAPTNNGGHIYAYRMASTNYIQFNFYNNQLNTSVGIDNSLTHLAFTYNRQTRIRQILINGQVAGQDYTVNPPAITSLTRFRIGFNTVPSSNYLQGAVADFRVYSSALSPAEIGQVMQMRMNSPTYRQLLPSSALVMPFTEPLSTSTSSAQIPDYSGYGHLATPTYYLQYNSLGTRQGLVFSSSVSQQLQITSTSALAITGALTISFWVCVTSLATQATVLSKQAYGEYDVVITTSGNIQFSHGSGVAGTSTSYTTLFQVITGLNKWYYIVITRQTGATNGKNVHIWANGAYFGVNQLGTTETTYTVGAAGSALYIGSTPSSTGYANMILSGLVISPVCWTQQEILAAMLSGDINTQIPRVGQSLTTEVNTGTVMDSLALHINAKDAVSVLGATPQYLPDYSGCRHTSNIQPTAGAVSFSAGATIPGGATRSLLFNGTTGYILCDGGSNGREYLGPSGSSSRTISMWINPSSLTGTGRPLISWGSSNTTTDSVYGSFDAYLNSTGNLVVNLNSQSDIQVSKTWDTRITTGNWSHLALVFDAANQPTDQLRVYAGNLTTAPTTTRLVSEYSNISPNNLVCLLDLAEETPNDRLSDASGYQNNGMYVGQRWIPVANLTYARIAHKLYEQSGQTYAVGGIRAPGVYTGTVEIFNGVSWSLGTSLPQERAYFGGTVYQSQMYAVGGRITASGSPTNTVISSSGGSWTSVTSMSTIRAECGAATLGDYLYAIGGLNTGTGTTYLATCERFNGTSWTAISNMNTARASPAVCIYNNLIFAIGGYNSTNLYLKTVEYFDGTNWNYAQPMNYPRYGATAIVQGNYIYVIGGTLASGVFSNTSERYDGKKWVVIGNLPQQLSFASAQLYTLGANYLFLVGGSPTGVGSTSSNITYRSVKPIGRWGEPVSWMPGTSSNIVIPASATTNLAVNNNHTVSMWVQPSSVINGTLFSAENTSSQDLCAIRINASGRVVYTMTNASSITNTVSSNTGLIANSWYHITTSYDGTNMRLYLDGQLTNTTASSGTTITGTPRDIYIGADWNTAAKDYYTGNLGECRIYRSALSSNTVSALYSTGTQSINRSQVRTLSSNRLVIGRGLSGGQQSDNYYSGYMDDIRIYDGAPAKYTDILDIWSNGTGSYSAVANWGTTTLEPYIQQLGSQSMIAIAPQPNQLPNQTFYNVNYTPSAGYQSFKGPGQEFSAVNFDLSGKILTYTPNTTATGYYWTVSTGTNWTTTPPPTFTPYSTTLVSGDDTPNTVVLPNPFTFYGTNYSTIYVSPNGYFSTIASSGLDGTYAGLYGTPQIAAARRDLYMNYGGTSYYGFANTSPTSTNDMLIGTWAATASYSDPSTRSSFQIIIYLNNAPAALAGNIIVNYGSVGTTGAQIVAGISNGGGTTAYTNNGSGVDLSAGSNAFPDMYVLTAGTSNLATQPGNTTPSLLLSQSLTCSNLVITNPQIQPPNLTSNCTGWWPLDSLQAIGSASNTLPDITGLGHTATKTGPGQSLWLVGPQNQSAIYLNGAKQDITIKTGATSTFPVSGTEFSISGWFNGFSNTTSAANNAIIGISTNMDTDRLIVYSSNSSNIIVGTSSTNTIGTIPVTSNAWNHLVITGTGIDTLGSNIRVYLNNYQIISTSATANLAANDKFYLGSKRTTASGGTNTNYFTGLLSDFRIYNRRLMPTEITQLYKFGHYGVIQTDTGSGLYSLASQGTSGSSSNSRLIKLVPAGYSIPEPEKPKSRGNLGISARVKISPDAAPSIHTVISTETNGAIGGWQLLLIPPRLLDLKLWFTLSDGVGAATAYNSAHTTPAYNGLYSGSGWTWQSAAKSGVAPVFNGSSNYIQVDSGSGLNTDTLVGNEITITGWVNVNSLAIGTRTIFGISNSISGAVVLGLSLSGTNNNVSVAIGAQTITANGRGPFNTWCFVALTIRAGIYVSVYLNNPGRVISVAGSPFGSDYYTSTLSTPLNITDTDMIYIGAQPGVPATSNYFAGSITDIRVYNHALEPGEIAATYYQQYQPCFLIQTNPQPATPKLLLTGDYLSADKWHHLAVSYSATGAQPLASRPIGELWVNGGLASTGNLWDLGYNATGGLLANTTANIIIGSSILSTGENARSYLQGWVDDVRVSRQPFQKSVITSLASGLLDCVLNISCPSAAGTNNTITGSTINGLLVDIAAGVNSTGALSDLAVGANRRKDATNTISAMGGLQIVNSPQLGSQFIFNGSGSYISIAGYLHSAYNRVWAFSCWITPDAALITGAETYILSKWTGAADGSSCYKLSYMITTGQIIGSVGIGATTISVNASITRGVPTHVLLQTTSNELILYINGVWAASTPLAVAAAASRIINVSNNVPVRIGCDSYGTSGTFFKGMISGIQMFESILPLATVAAIANSSANQLIGISGGISGIQSNLAVPSDSSKQPQINSGLVFWLSNPQLDLSAANIASTLGANYPLIRLQENSQYRAIGIASNTSILSPSDGAGSVSNNSLGSAIRFSGVANSNLAFNSSDILSQLDGSPELSMAFWAKFYNSTPLSNETVLSLRDPSSTTANTMIEVIRDSTTKQLVMNFGAGAANDLNSNTLAITDTNWHHCVITYGANTSVSNTAATSKRNYYLDGIHVGLSSIANIGRPTLSNCGVLALGNDYYYSGAGTVAANIGLQDFRIYNRVLGMDEISILYNSPGANSQVNGGVSVSVPIEVPPIIGNSPGGYEIIGLRKRAILTGELVDTIGAGSGSARDNLVCTVNTNNSTSVSDQNWQVKPPVNYRSPGYLSNAIIPSVATGMVLGGGAVANTTVGMADSAAVINLGNSAGNLYIGTSNIITEQQDWSVAFGISGAGAIYSNSALMTFQSPSSATSYRSWWLNSSNAGELMFQVDSTGTANGAGVFLPSSSAWSHLAISKGTYGLTANTMSIYQDGVCRWRRVVNINPGGAQYLTIGSSPDILSGVGFAGRVKDIQIYNSCLPDGVIRNLAAQSLGSVMELESPTGTTGAPLHHWLFGTTTSSNTVPDLGVLGSALGFSPTGVSVQYRNQGNESWSKVAQPGLPSDGVGYFSGSGECIAYSCPVARDGARTVAFWMRRASIGVLDEGLVTWGTGSVSGGWFAIGLNSSGQISVRTSSTMTPRVVSTTAILDNRWYHVCVVVLPAGNSTTSGVGNCNNIRVFVNGYHDTLAPFGTGFEANPVNTVKSSSSSSDWLYVGSHGLLNYFSGWMDDIRVYGYSLTPDEILGLARGASQLAVVRR